MALKKNESKLWQRLKNNIKNGHFVRIESPTIQGIPDINYCINGVEGWIELKVNTSKISPLSKWQKAWIYTRVKNGGRVFIITYTPSERVLKLFKPRPSTRDPLSDPPVHNFRDPISWSQVAEILQK
jgi:hypothetical protein